MNNSDKSKNTFSVTTPLYYVNDLPHIGSAYTTIAADVIARFERLRGKPVLLITGTDEHGQKIQRTAETSGRTPIEHCDQIAAGFDNLWQKLEIHYDRFIRTTTSNHEAIVKEFFQRVWDNGDIYTGRQQGWYCVSCEEFKEERELLDGHRCPIHTNKQAEWRDEQNYFFRLSKYQKPLEALYANRPDFIQPESRRNEVLNFVAQGLQDFSISRVNVDWGFKLPIDPSHTLYVWFDALLGYITALLEPSDQPTLANATAKWWPVSVQLLGKDILRFHAVYLPAMLMSAGLPVQNRLFGHGFLTKDGQKMGKSLGNTLDPIALVNRYGADAVRYYFLKEIEFGKDGDFNETRFVNTLNADLANDLGNLLNRTLGMVRKYCGGVVPNLNGYEIPNHNPLKAIGLTLGEEVAKAYENLAFSAACEAILHLIRTCNKYIDEQAPWSLYKQKEQKALEEVLYSVLESVRLSAYLLSPIIPNISNEIYQQLGLEVNLKAQQTLSLSAPNLTDHSTTASTEPLQQLPLADKILRPFIVAPSYLREFLQENQTALGWGSLVLLLAGVASVAVEILDKIEDIPLISPALEITGIAYTSWFIYRYLLLASHRQELFKQFQSLAEQLVGTLSDNGEAKPKNLTDQIAQPTATLAAAPAIYSIHAQWGLLPANQTLGQAKPVFQRLELVESITS